jgi:hypothetical protein
MKDAWMLDDRAFDRLTPHVRPDALLRQYDNEALAWSPTSPAPAYLDPLATLIYQLLDADASVADLVADVHDVVGVPRGIARNQIRRVVAQLDGAALLVSSTEPPADPLGHDVFSQPPNP